jgi:hypothetical protein
LSWDGFSRDDAAMYTHDTQQVPFWLAVGALLGIGAGYLLYL